MTEYKELVIPRAIVEATLNVINRVNGETEIELIVIAIMPDNPPTMTSSIEPPLIPEILQWLIDHHANARVDFDRPGGKPN